MSNLEIDNDNGEIRVDGYEYAASKISVKTYSISSEVSQIPNSADIRITDNDGYTDHVTVTGGSNVTIIRNNASKFTIDSSDSDTTYSLESSSSLSPLGAAITLRDSSNTLDNVYIVQGTGIGVAYTGSPDSITVSNAGVTSLNGSTGSQYVYNTITDGVNPTSPASGHTTFTMLGSNGISVVTSTDTATISMSQVTRVKGSDSIIGGGSSANVLTTNVIPINSTIEISGSILFAFTPGGATNTFDITLSTGSGTIGANTSKVAIGFTCHAGGVAGSTGEAIKNVPTFTYPQQIANTNIHVIRFSGLFQTDGTTPNSLVINMKNNNGGAAENLVVYAKSFLKHNIV